MYHWGSSSLLADTLQGEHVVGKQFKVVAYYLWQPPASPHLQGWSQANLRKEEKFVLRAPSPLSQPSSAPLPLPPPQGY